MPRRIALALALALTVVTTFSIVVVGARTGLFGGDDSAEADQQFAAVAPPTNTPIPPPPAEPTQQAWAPREPVYVTEYVYVDEPAPAAQPRLQATSNTIPTTAPAPTGAAADESQAQPTAPAAEQPTQPPAVAPTLPAAQPTAPPAVPTTPPTTVPTTPPAPAAPPSGQGELEFTGTVSAMSGSMVTFTHGGSSTIVKITKNLDRLHVGSTVKVHAIWVQSGYYVAKEIEFEEGN